MTVLFAVREAGIVLWHTAAVPAVAKYVRCWR
jgi:hypothetical protein